MYTFSILAIVLYFVTTASLWSTAMVESSLNPESSAESSSDDERVFSNPVLGAAHKLCQAFIDFEESNLEIGEQAPGMIEALRENIAAVEKLKEHIISCETGAVSFARLLRTLLDFRFSFLENRKNLIEVVRKGVVPGLIYGPTRPEHYDTLPLPMQTLARMSTDRYQLINQMIINVWQLVDPRTLPENVKNFVRCSRTLWPNLRNEREYLGHPDEAILNYEREFDDKDIKLYEEHIKEYPHTIELLGYSKGTSIEGYWTCYQRSLVDKEFVGYRKIGDMPYPEWLLPYSALPQPRRVGVEEKMSSRPIIASAAASSASASAPMVTNVTPTSSGVPTTSSIAAASASFQPRTQAIRSSYLRQIREQTQQASAEDGLLKKRRQEFIDTVFDPKKFNTITYGNFKNEWNSLPGHSVVEETGGSHKTLVAGDQNFPIFAHGDGMRYTKKTIKYLREALSGAGYRPSWMSVRRAAWGARVRGAAASSSSASR